MSKSMSLFSALFCTFIWGTTFIAQDTGMDKIGPLTFNATRFFVGFLSIMPIALLIEKKKISKEINNNKNISLVSKELKEISDKCRNLKIDKKEFFGGSMTVTSLGGIYLF